jgi:predicted nucleic acid-binding protein
MIKKVKEVLKDTSRKVKQEKLDPKDALKQVLAEKLGK